MPVKGAEQSNLGPIGPGQFRPCLGLEIGQQGHPQLCWLGGLIF